MLDIASTKLPLLYIPPYTETKFNNPSVVVFSNCSVVKLFKSATLLFSSIFLLLLLTLTLSLLLILLSILLLSLTLFLFET